MHFHVCTPSAQNPKGSSLQSHREEVVCWAPPTLIYFDQIAQAMQFDQNISPTKTLAFYSQGQQGSQVRAYSARGGGRTCSQTN